MQNENYANGQNTYPYDYQAELEKPMTTGQFLGALFIGIIPIAGLIIYLVWAFSNDTNINKRNFSRAFLIYQLIMIGVGILFAMLIFAAFASYYSDIVTTATVTEPYLF